MERIEYCSKLVHHELQEIVRSTDPEDVSNISGARSDAAGQPAILENPCSTNQRTRLGLMNLVETYAPINCSPHPWQQSTEHQPTLNKPVERIEFWPPSCSP